MTRTVLKIFNPNSFW